MVIELLDKKQVGVTIKSKFKLFEFIPKAFVILPVIYIV